MSNLLAGILLFFLMHIVIWIQVNGQFVWPRAKEHPITMALLGLPISYVLIIATKYVVAGFDGLLWPGRLLGFGLGMIIMAILTWYILGEGISTKTLVSLTLAVTLVMLQVLWK